MTTQKLSAFSTKKSLRENTSIEQPQVSLVSAAFVVASAITVPAQAEDKNKVTTLDQVTVEEQRVEAGANPYADPDAPYKIDRSANTKYTEPLLNTSKVISVISKEQLEDANTTSLKDLMRTEPGVTLGTGEGGNALGDRFFIRGFDARGDMFVDGLRDPGSTVREVFATEQVEISKGPSSTFAGRGTTGGAVNSVSKKPQDSNFGRATLQVGDANRGTLDVNRVVNDKLAVRANVMLHDEDVSGNELRYDERKGLALAAEYKATDNTSLLLDYYHLEGDAMPDFGHPWNPETDAPFDVDISNFYGLTKRDFQETSADILTGTFTTDFSPDTRLTSKTRVGETSNDYIVTAPGAATDGRGGPLILPIEITTGSKSAAYENTFFGNNTQLTHERYINGKEHVMSIGLDISDEEVVRGNFDIVGFDDLTHSDVANPDNTQGSGTVTRRTTGDTTTDAKSRSIYVMDTVKFNDKWQAFGGLRYDKFDINTQSTDYPSGEITGNVKYDRGFTNGHVGAIYKPRENGSIYTAYSTSSNLPGEMYDSTSVAYGGLADGMEDVKPEQNTNFEIGTKWEVADGNLLLGGALFQLTKKNRIENAAGRGEPADIQQTGETKIRGIELSAAGNLTPKLNLSGGLSYLDTEVTDSIDADSIGQDLANVAEKSATVQVKYQATPKLALGGLLAHTGEIKGGTFAATTGNSIGSSNRLDVMAEYKLSKKTSLQANVKNVTDESIYDALYRSGSPFTFTSPGRTANVSLTYNF